MAYHRFPARVQTSDGTHVNRSAVVVIDGRAELAVQRARSHGEAASVQVIATLDDVTVDSQRGRVVILTAADGQTWEVGAGDGCGCKSPLQRWYQDRMAGQAMGT